MAERVDPKLKTYLSHLEKRVEPRLARQMSDVDDRLLSSWLDDPRTRTKIEAASRGVVQPETLDARDAPMEEHGFPWQRFAKDQIGRLRAIDEVLAAAGFHEMSPWWDQTFELFYASGKMQFTCRDGRRGGKSSDSSRAVVSECVGVERHLPPGEAGVCPIISWSQYEANKRLDTIEAILKALGMRAVDKRPEEFGTYQRTTELGRKLIRSLDIARNTIEFAIYPATIAGVSGFTAICAMCDEVAKWRDDKTGANPASVVFESLRPCFATQPDAHMFVISSSFSTIDAHHDAIEAGDTDIQFLARLGETAAVNDREQRLRAVDMFEQQALRLGFEGKPSDAAVALSRAKALRESIDTVNARSPNVPTWASNPSLSIERTLLLEPDFEVWLREYASVPTGSGAAYFFDHATIDRCNSAPATIVPRVPSRVAVGIDPGLETNAFGCCVWGLDADGAWLLDALELVPSPGAPLDDEESFTTCAELAVRWGATQWATDIHYLATARRIGAKHKLSTVLAPNDNGKVWLDFRREAGRGRVSIHGLSLSTRIARQLKATQSQAMAGGKTRILLDHESGGAHGDVASAAVRGWWLVSRNVQNAPLWMPKARRPDRRVA